MGQLSESASTTIDDLSCNLRGKFLIAMPGLKGSFFSHTITYICDHSADGALGLVINSPLNLNLQEIFEQLEVNDSAGLGATPVLAGGPVDMGRGFVLHSPDKRWESTLPITDDISLTTCKEIIESIAHGHGPRRFLITLGYAGWGAGQLEQEMADNAWLTVDADPDLIFNTPIDQRWNMAARKLGIDLNLISSVAGHA